MSISICISRQYGSGGKEIGELLAKKLGYKFYDSKLVDLAAESGDITLDHAKKADEHTLNPWLYTPLYTGIYASSTSSDAERMFKIQSEIIKEKASKDNCIFVGRAADAILEHEKDTRVISLFIYAPVDWRIKRLIRTEGYADDKQAFSALRKKDKQRRNYYNYYTGKEYDEPMSYDLCIDSSFLGIEKTAELLCEFIHYMENLSK